MEVGIFGGAEYPGMFIWPASPGTTDPETTLLATNQAFEIYELADELGLDHVSVSEHHYGGRMDPNPLITAAVLAQRLKRARIMVLGRTVPLGNPVLLAEELGQLDVLMNGRLEVALLRGTPNEYVTYFTNPQESRAMLAEAVELMRAAWTEPDPFGWEGRYYQFRTVAALPRPIQAGGPRILLSGNSDESARFAARQRAMIGISYTPSEFVPGLIALYREAAEETGWTPDASDILYRNYVYVAETDEQAEAEAARHGFGDASVHFVPRAEGMGAALGEVFRNYSFKGITTKPRFCGSPESVIAQLREFNDLGVGRVDLTFSGSGLPHELGRRNLELFAAEVLPAIRAFEPAEVAA
ncbi:MAG TPA: LLM class flavin-dependent oxidoreductase [Baekduia sp.]|nr:LLM class flavin-dependent oxidoreductase [Baekduia sp.]